MRQVTGKTNPPESGYKVSIQQSLDGHSFSCSPLPDPTGDETTLEVEVNVVPGTGKLELTGNLGDVMK